MIAMTIPKLKPCPFCGSTNLSQFTSSTIESDEVGYGFYCHSCGTKGPHAPSKELAAEVWNRRTNDIQETNNLHTQ